MVTASITAALSWLLLALLLPYHGYSEDYCCLIMAAASITAALSWLQVNQEPTTKSFRNKQHLKNTYCDAAKCAIFSASVMIQEMHFLTV